MFATLLLVLAGKVERPQRIRVWVAMMAGSFIAALYQSIWFYLALDIAIAVAIMAPPKGIWQRVIGLFYVAMVLLSVGYAMRDMMVLQFSLSPMSSPDSLKSAHDFLGWSALVVLALWGGYGVFRTYRPSLGGSGDMETARQGRVQ